MRKYVTIATVAAVVLTCVSGAQAEVVMDWVTVGDPGNVDDTHGDGYGGVDYVYNIGKYEVTNSQYAEFLNAVAAVGNPHGLYNTEMGGGWNDIGGISRSGSGTTGDPWVYAARANRGNRPVNYVNWYDALRFANWMHNGQPTGAQDPSTTEDGAYDMSLGSSVVRKPDALVFLPSEDEWYKAAYYKGGGTDAGYWDYQTQSDTVPTAEAPPGLDMVNGSANYYRGGHVDPTYYTTEVGAYNAKPSDGAYGTFDQGGNVSEWNEADIFGDGSIRGRRSGSFRHYDTYLRAALRYTFYWPICEDYYVGFRVAEVSGPATLSLDIKPGSCPNPLNRNSHGVLPVALVGTEYFDVTTVDVSSVWLSRADGVGGEVAPNEGPPGPHSVFADVATPFAGEPCDCHALAGDGITDLSMKFRTDDVVEALELNDLSMGDEVELIITGLLTDGTEFASAGDCILIVPLGISNLIVTSSMPELFVEVTPANLCNVDDSGFADFQREYTSGTAVTLTAPETCNDLAFSGWEIDGIPVPSVSGTISVTLIESYMTAEAVYVPVSRLPAPAPTPTPIPRPAPRPVIR